MVEPGPRRPRPWLTMSNALTSTRLFAAPFFYGFIVSESWLAACVLFWLAVASDLVDGRLARSRDETSAFGGVLDHGSDAIFVTVGSAALAVGGWVPVLLPILIAAAFVQYALDSRILAGRELRTSRVGRWNGILYFVPAGVIVTRQMLGFAWPVDAIVLAIGWLLVVSTLISMGDRLIGVWSSARSDPDG